MKNLEHLAQEYIEDQFIFDGGHACSKIETIEKLDDVLEWVKHAYAVLYFLDRNADEFLDSDDHPFLLQALLKGLFDHEPSLFGLLTGLQDYYVSDLDQEAISRLGTIREFKIKYSSEDGTLRENLNQLCQRALQGDQKSYDVICEAYHMRNSLDEVLKVVA